LAGHSVLSLRWRRAQALVEYLIKAMLFPALSKLFMMSATRGLAARRAAEQMARGRIRQPDVVVEAKPVWARPD
jgi:hypothetical protein